MEIAYIHQYFRTPEDGGAIRSFYIAKALAERGHNVHVITAHNAPQRREHNCAGFKVYYLPVPYRNEFGFWRRVWSFMHFAFLAYRMARKLRPLDLCYVSSTPLSVGLPALRLLKTLSVPFIFEARDLWPEAPVGLGVLNNRVLIALARKLEYRLYSKAISVIALSPPAAEYIRQKNPETVVHLVTNMADCDYFAPSENFVPPGPQAPFTIAYTGALGYVNNVEYLLHAASACRKAGLPLNLVIAGDGAHLDFLQQKAAEMQLQNITFTGHLDKDGVRKALNGSHAACISFRPEPVLQYSSPNKLFDAMAAGKAIITNTGGWIRQLVEDENIGFYCDPECPETLAVLVERYYRDPQLLCDQQRNSRKQAEHRYSRTQMCSRLVDIVENSVFRAQSVRQGTVL